MAHHIIQTDSGSFSVSVPNQIVQGTDFYISYNDVDTDSSMYGCDTTALVIGQMDNFYILNGDHREAYAPLIPQGLEACLAYFVANVDQVNKRSDNPTVLDAPSISFGL